METDLQRLITSLMQRDIEDPRLLGTVITSVAVSRENQSAVIKVHGMNREEAALVVEKLTRLIPHFERELRRILAKRRLPTLKFEWDDGLDAGNDMVELLNKLGRV